MDKSVSMVRDSPNYILLHLYRILKKALNSHILYFNYGIIFYVRLCYNKNRSKRNLFHWVIQMQRKFIILIIVSIVAIVMVLGATFLMVNGNDPEYANQNILVLLVDPSEHSPGPGAVDFAFVVELENYSVSNLTTIYPTGPGLGVHPTAAPNMEMNNIKIKYLYLHDALWDVPLNEGTKNAQEIVEYNKGIKTNSVVIIRPEAVDAILESIGGVDVNGTHVTNNSQAYLREEQYSENISRPDIVKSFGYAIKDASKNSSKRSSMISAITVQYLEGNIIVVPNDMFIKMVSNQALKSIFG